MNTTIDQPRSPGRVIFGQIVRWTARVLSLLIILVVGFEMAEGFQQGAIVSIEAVPIALLFLGVILGMILAWWWEGLGGAVTVGSMVGVAVAFDLLKGHFPPAMASVFAVPALLFLLSRILNGPRRKRASRSDMNSPSARTEGG